ncbi:hypothetical protein EW146_g9654 [Bondarzewia mesenterica]|uniref:Reverse transcriptase n=1 Tax=Bondarzewia mesenterica TaxID=1095465 RepID=A0A4S4L4N8_9AGAM|nr:hypothetical protein EW146_g9654 [Bondarzewia mesenterica]
MPTSSKNASCTSNGSHPPIVSEGPLTTFVLIKWRTYCRAFFIAKRVSEEEQAARVLVSFEDPQIAVWIDNERDRLERLTFHALYLEIRQRWLPTDWDLNLFNKITKSTQPASTPFDEWYQQLAHANSGLQETSYYFDDKSLRRSIEGGLHADLLWEVRNVQPPLTSDLDLQTWIERVSRLDEKIRRSAFSLSNLSTALPRLPQRGPNVPSPVLSRSHAISSTKTIRVPRLSDEERSLLQENGGCFKCRKFFAGHTSKTCDGDFPDGASYKPLTRAAADAAKHTQSSPVTSRGRVAAVLPAITDDTTGVLGDGTESEEYVHSHIIASIPSPTPSSNASPFATPSLVWPCQIHGPSSLPVQTEGLIDVGSQFVLICRSLSQKLGLRQHKLPQPIPLGLAFDAPPLISSSCVPLSPHDTLSSVPPSAPPLLATHWVKVRLSSRDYLYSARSVRALIAPDSLCLPLILDGPFLKHNQIVVDIDASSCIAKDCGYDLLQPPPVTPSTTKLGPVDARRQIQRDRKLMFEQLNCRLLSQRADVDRRTQASVNYVASVDVLDSRIQELVHADQLKELNQRMRQKFADRFPSDIPPTAQLPTDVYYRIKLKNPNMTIARRSYSCPRKYREAWSTLLDQHLAAGRIRPSSSEYCSPSFVIPKADPTVLPCWVNDYRIINANTVPDNHPLPRVDDILADCAKGKIWGKMDMTNSFFQTRVHPDDIHLTAVTTPFGLYEWTVMPMGGRNAPATHQRRMCAALRKYIVSRILDWPIPQTVTDVRAFLGLVRYISAFLPQLAEHTRVLTPLTTLEAEKSWPGWTNTHQDAFIAIKALVVSRECLTTIDHEHPGDNKIFVTCDASDWRTGAVLSYGPTWESARPVAFDSCQLSGAALNYPVHEKELLAIVRALQKWRCDLLGTPFVVRTDHRTLENFQTQRDLSRRQMRWQDFLSSYDFTIQYLPGADNSVADSLSRLFPDGEPHVSAASPTTTTSSSPIDTSDPAKFCQSTTGHIASVLSITSDPELLVSIRTGYTTDPWCVKLQQNLGSMPGVTQSEGLLYVGGCLVVPRVNALREQLFRLAHDSLGHFGANKSYASLRSSYYWPNMRRDLEQGYVPSCNECQRNKSLSSRPTGPLHPLPVPDARGDSVAIDFIGPLPEEKGFNCIASFTDRLRSDIRLVPCRMDISAEKFAAIFFDHWYCENGLPLEIISDRDKLFISSFWKSLTRLCGVTLKMSSSFHPETDGASERMNKTVNQCLRFHVDRQQKGWVRSLPLVRFHMMNTLNAFTGLSPFQLRMGRSPRLIPPLVSPSTSSTSKSDVSPSTSSTSKSDVAASDFISHMIDLEFEAKDTLLTSKLSQAHSTNAHRNPDPVLKIGDRVLLSTFHRRREYTSHDQKHVAKFMPRYDGPYKIIHAFPNTSTYELSLPSSSKTFSTFHISQLRVFRDNDDVSFPSRTLSRPGPLVSVDGFDEWEIDRIIDQRRRGRGFQYLVQWKGWGHEDSCWISGRELDDCAALDAWEALPGNRPTKRRSAPRTRG